MADRGSYIHVTAPILAGVVGHVHVGMDRGVIQSSIRSTVLGQVALIGGIFVAAVVVVYVQARGVSRPLVRLTQYARTVAANADAMQNDAASEEGLASIAERKDDK